MAEPGGYRRVLADRQLLFQLFSVFMGTVPLGMMPLAIVLGVHGWTGSFTAAGYASAAFTGGTACGLLVQGWSIDRFGARISLGVAVLVLVISTGGAVLLGPGSHLHAGFVVCVFLAGVAMPEITTAVRVWLAGSALASRARAAAYALLGGLFQAGLVIGPLLATAALQTGGPRIALSVTAVLAGVAAVAYMVGHRPTHPAPSAQRTARASGQSASVGVLLMIAALTGAPTGVLGILAPRIATTGGSTSLAGVLLAALAAGEVIGAIGYGSVRWRTSGYVRLVLGLSVSGVALLAAALATDLPWLVVVCFFVAGMGAGPIAVLLSTATERAAGPAAVGRISGLRVAVGLGATSAGSSLTGIGAASLTSSAILAVTATLSLAAMAVARANLRLWGDARSDEP